MNVYALGLTCYFFFFIALFVCLPVTNFFAVDVGDGRVLCGSGDGGRRDSSGCW